MNEAKRIFALFAALLTVPSSMAQYDVPVWPPQVKLVAIAGCREAILSRAEQDYRKRHNLTETPPGFRQRIAPALEQFLATCNCVFDRLEQEWSFEYFTFHREEALERMKNISNGPCAPQVRNPIIVPNQHSPLKSQE
jgi:hypothetical protein